MKKLLIFGIALASNAAFAGTYFYNGALTLSSPTFTNPYSSNVSAYTSQAFTVDTAGTYTLEVASPNTAGTGNISNAMDTVMLLYTGSFNPTSPAGYTLVSDDFTGALTVLPGPYTGTISATATGYTGAEPASRLTPTLATGTTYYLVTAGYRASTYVGTAAGGEGAGVGPYYVGLSGPGNIAPVPEPASMTILALGGLGLLRRRKKS